MAFLGLKWLKDSQMPTCNCFIAYLLFANINLEKSKDLNDVMLDNEDSFNMVNVQLVLLWIYFN